MNDAYNRIYRFHGRNDIDNLSITEQNNNPVPIDFSKVKQDIKITSDSLNNKDGNTREQFSVPNPRSKKSKSIPFILPPPATEARQIFRTSKTQKIANDKITSNKSEESKLKESKILSEKQRIENLKASYLLTPFSPMLKWSPSLPSKNPSIRTQFFLANQSTKTLEQFNYLGNSLVSSLAKEQEYDFAVKKLNKQIAPDDDKDSAPPRNTLTLQDEFSLLLEETDSNIYEETVNSCETMTDVKTLQTDGSKEMNNSKDIPFEMEQYSANGAAETLQIMDIESGGNAITLEEDFIQRLQGDAQTKFIDQNKEDSRKSNRSSHSTALNNESESFQNDFSIIDDDSLYLEETFYHMLTESSSEEDSYVDSKLTQDETFEVLSEFYSELEESSIQEINDTLMKDIDNIEESSSSSGYKEFFEQTDQFFDDDHEETSSFIEHLSIDLVSPEKHKYMQENENIDGDISYFKGDFSKMLEKAYAILEVSQPEGIQLESSHEDPPTNQDLFSNLIDAAFESLDKAEKDIDWRDSGLNKVSELLKSFSIMLNDSNEREHLIDEQSSTLAENCCLAEIESSSDPVNLCTSEPNVCESSSKINIEETLAMDNLCSSEESSITEKCFLETEDSSYDFEHHCDENENSLLILEESSSFEESSSSHEEESANLQDVFEQELLAEEEISQDESFGYKYCESKIPMPTVKIPVLLGKLDIDLDIFDIFPLDEPIKNISKVEWSVQSLETHTVLPSKIIFIKGTLIADIEYINSGEKTSLHSAKIPISFNKTSEVCWLFPPDMPKAKTQKEFMFKGDGCDVLSSHFESSQSFTEKIKSHIRSIHFVWHNDITRMENTNVHINGSINLHIDLLQEQYVDLND